MLNDFAKAFTIFNLINNVYILIHAKNLNVNNLSNKPMKYPVTFNL